MLRRGHGGAWVGMQDFLVRRNMRPQEVQLTASKNYEPSGDDIAHACLLTTGIYRFVFESGMEAG